MLVELSWFCQQNLWLCNVAVLMSLMFPQTSFGTEAEWQGMARAHAAKGFYSSGQDVCAHTIHGEQPPVSTSSWTIPGSFWGSVKWPRPESSEKPLGWFDSRNDWVPVPGQWWHWLICWNGQWWRMHILGASRSPVFRACNIRWASKDWKTPCFTCLIAPILLPL